jgi:hypothetical protein
VLSDTVVAISAAPSKSVSDWVADQVLTRSQFYKIPAEKYEMILRKFGRISTKIDLIVHR